MAAGKITGIGKIVVVLGALLAATGCVSTKEYRERLDEIDGLKDQVAALEEKSRLQGEVVARLEGENESLRQSEASLTEASAALAHRMESGKLELVRENTALKAQVSELEFGKKNLEDELARKEESLDERTAELAKLSEEARRAVEDKRKSVEELKTTYDDLVSELSEEIKKGRVEVTQLKDKLSLSMVDQVLFDSGSAEVNREGRKVLDRVAGILKKVTDRQIRIEGHTDNVKIGERLRERFPTNWELSTARATNVVRYLKEQGGLDPALLSAAGYSEYRPVATNDTPEGKARNRRIEVVLVPLDTDQPPAAKEEGKKAGK